MPNNEFADFVERQAQKAAEDQAVDWAKQKAEWLHFIDKLYSDVKTYLSEYIDSGSIRYVYHSMEITEDYIGTYSVNQMEISIGPAKVKLVPVGTLLIGSKGRVDMSGPQGAIVLLLIPRDTYQLRMSIVQRSTPEKMGSASIVASLDWQWKILAGRRVKQPGAAGQVGYIDLGKEQFLQAILEVANG